MDSKRQTLGQRARRYGYRCELGTSWLLWLRGWDLVACNLKAGRFELDLLVTRGDELRRVEVKAAMRPWASTSGCACRWP